MPPHVRTVLSWHRGLGISMIVHAMAYRTGFSIFISKVGIEQQTSKLCP